MGNDIGLGLLFKAACFDFRSTNVGSSVIGTLKGQMKPECIYEIINFPKYHQKVLIDFCPESLFRLGMLCNHLSRVAFRIIKTNHI